MPELRASSLRTLTNPIKSLTTVKSPRDSQWYYTKAYRQNHDPTDEITIAIKLATTLPIRSYHYLLYLHKSEKYGYRV